MTVNEFIDLLIPLLGIALLVIAIVFGIQLVQILIRVKRIVERAETISDISGWAGLVKKLLNKKTSKS
ncbi:MAG: hypothetical protein VW397_05620 [Candidatus Margulisiibacteriota bacterium]|jgi:hypothetical protein